ncbi:hypothetical protein [Caldalkalibacillus mannanilyticus]|uniref:hypothetical protein n=1 Tax=Caldalkalibacillus mannanilyticus TaxID=1418 RepID=UPI000468C25C|nr:hypothetical protein [Caldalkalibacillus mannanilyticus]
MIQQVREQYVFPEVAEKIVASLEKSLHEGAYHSITNIEEFCEEVSNELLSISQDKHLRVIYRPEIPSEETTSIQERMVEEERRRGQVQNYGIHKVERLPGNIGIWTFANFIVWISVQKRLLLP